MEKHSFCKGPEKKSAGKQNKNGANQSSRLTLKYIKKNYTFTIFFSEIINKNTNNSCILFAVDRLTNPPVPISPELFSISKCNEFASFFNDKIQAIKHSINSSIPKNKVPNTAVIQK